MAEAKKRFPVITIIAAVIGSVLGSALVREFYSRRDPARFDKALVEAANELNKNLPMTVDGETRLDNTMAGPNRTFIYRYTLVNVDKAQVDPGEMERQLRPRLITQYRTADMMKSFRESGVTLHYQYSDRHGVEIAVIIIAPGDIK